MFSAFAPPPLFSRKERKEEEAIKSVKTLLSDSRQGKEGEEAKIGRKKRGRKWGSRTLSLFPSYFFAFLFGRAPKIDLPYSQGTFSFIPTFFKKSEWELGGRRRRETLLLFSWPVLKVTRHFLLLLSWAAAAGHKGEGMDSRR